MEREDAADIHGHVPPDGEPERRRPPQRLVSRPGVHAARRRPAVDDERVEAFPVHRHSLGAQDAILCADRDIAGVEGFGPVCTGPGARRKKHGWGIHRATIVLAESGQCDLRPSGCHQDRAVPHLVTGALDVLTTVRQLRLPTRSARGDHQPRLRRNVSADRQRSRPTPLRARGAVAVHAGRGPPSRNRSPRGRVERRERLSVRDRIARPGDLTQYHPPDRQQPHECDQDSNRH